MISAICGEELNILAVSGGREKEKVKQFLKTVPKKLWKKLKGVCSDMYDGYISAAKEVFGDKTDIIADRFHVVRLYRSGSEDLCKKELSEEEYKKPRGVMRGLRRKPGKLNDEQAEVMS